MIPVRRGAALACTIAIAAAGLTGCGGSDGGARTGERPASGEPPVGGAGPAGFDARRMATYTCDDWRAADTDGRLQALQALHGIVGGAIVGRHNNGRGRVLADEDAYKLFDRMCKPDYAGGFLLYKVYGRAAGFAGVEP
ncbi:hypothetical protein [Patulibacter defluvii]|uniref:hypothetical protein n=1 Tax=Patulibacter defluvii TaxID=3095358 RepID=UPI002A7505DC|nr:hypothetical protein [Patulibacter sp. DM4]